MERNPWVPVLAVALAPVLVVVLLLGHLRFWAAQSRLPAQGRLSERVAGCPGPVEILVDRIGVPHVRAGSDHAAYFAQGWLHARERFFQMELARRSAAGRLAEVFGAVAVPWDRKARTWRLDAAVRRHHAALDPADRAALEAYAAGVNGALTDLGRWVAPELWVLGVDPEPWTGEDSLRVGVLLHHNLTWSMGEELRRAVEISRLGPDPAVALWGWTPAEARQWIPPVDLRTTPRREEEALRPPLSGEGSNNWAVAPERTATGRPLLANDPHVGVSVPGTWFPIHLQAPQLDVAGASVAGAPGVVIGHNRDVAWGFTMSLLDDQDLWVLNLDEDGERELVDGTWRPLRTITERISVRWRSEPVLLKVRLSERGPIVRESRREPLALSWTGLEGGTSLGAFLRLDRARTVLEAAEAFREVTGPSMNLVAADTGGRILHQVIGRMPERPRGAGRLPAPGFESEWAWSGLLPYERNPRTLDPAEGFVATANHDLFAEGDYPMTERLPGDFASPWRIRRIRSALATAADWDVESSLDLQADLQSGRAVAMLKLLWPELSAHDGSAARTLMEWDGVVTSGSVAPHLFSRLVEDLRRAAGGDEAARTGLPWSPLDADGLLRLLAGGLGDDWWDDVRTERIERRADIVAETLSRLDATMPLAPWGEVHSAHFDHPLLRLPLVGPTLGRSWSRGPVAVGGDATTVNAHYWRPADPYRVTAIPSLRFVADVGAWDRCVLGVPLGVSGRPWSEHYADQLTDWVAGRAAPLWFSAAAVEREAVLRIELSAAGGETADPTPSERAAP